MTREENSKKYFWWIIDRLATCEFEELTSIDPAASDDDVIEAGISEYKALSKHDQRRREAYWLVKAPRMWEDDWEEPWKSPDMDKAVKFIDILAIYAEMDILE